MSLYQKIKKLKKEIAVTPDIAKKYIDLGFEVLLSENYGSHLGITDNSFKEVGAKVIKDEKIFLMMLICLYN